MLPLGGVNQKTSSLATIILGSVFRSLLIATITFLSTRHAIQADVAQKLMRGDTVSLWSGTIPINFTLVLNVMVGVALPIVVPIAWGIWVRVVSAYQTIVAVAEKFGTVGEHPSQLPSVQTVIKAVATNTAPEAPVEHMGNFFEKKP